ncbi:MAG: fumarylacetoacetate hydrolase family protein [Sedimentisphaerales bacterium]|jgi:2-keto-4-pentenoate hydratase/2-oxohepta-3-ene-1,7-dioic acid hydratase in catechol pathway|nr:fumarylacetoacetate hydrolase family protein [Sedimentisphaerales bacterium]
MNIFGQICPASDGVLHYMRFRYQGQISYGIGQDQQVYRLQGGLFENPRPVSGPIDIEDVEILCPCEPTKILAVGLNYANHMPDRPRPVNPELFFMPVSALLAPGGTIMIPPGTSQCEAEGEMVVVVGKKAKGVPVEKAGQYIFGVTCGNDVSARDWQRKDLQWWRAKGCDTFAPFGPVIATGLCYDDLLLTTRINGHICQQQRTSEMLFNACQILSFASQFVTLMPGDIIFTGTPGETYRIIPGDVVEVELEGVGVLRNIVA